ncbi:hypothetical protein DMC30DRAFT_416222 [Rhodotorula diobovata]|uniref:Ion transport domain-containing protein n=1 Tax=Rhodotorula diobovata TaxID=5288 RepID=A0A5C5FY40_9BASI|nr:hypothetical protein DMC30DRAFT_416222 [Rhodotorula diobovata]
MSSPLLSPSRTPPPGATRLSDYDDGSSSHRTPHFISRTEAIRGAANRVLFSQFYIFLYLSMAIISLATVVLSATSECPTLAFYILEIGINVTLIAEVTIRLLAFGSQFWQSYWNALDLAITLFCAVTLVVIFFSGCSAKGEEVFDTFLLVARNLFQFGRLALVLRKSGKSVFARPAPIDLSAARAYSLDLDLDDEEALSTERRAMGGDLEAQRKQARRTGGPEARGFLLDSDDED